ncbi:hypothetical protein E4U42_007485 [Claviceps africana]|uniref:Meiotically up-regulated 65 protein n=1 Tax=Claviceps africana TaxID=83212 RepID=A0A8K0NKU5_9HYPO|nr:hypothetical protein E4U42_007485 [Claviceps africana]
MVKVRSSRRVAGLKPIDYDHEIDLVNHDGAEPTGHDSASTPPSDVVTRRDSTTSPLLSSAAETEHDQGGQQQSSGSQESQDSQDNQQNAHHSPHQDVVPRAAVSQRQEAEAGAEVGLASQNSLPHPVMQPHIQVQVATPDVFSDAAHRIIPRRPQEARETALDILYENERGCFMCGIALFSSQALGGLDPSAWTNAFHKPSPTNIRTAVVPDPSWEWVWPEWRVNYQDGVDEGGWEYSFAFAKAFSWHTAQWWNSFVRRRAWIRKRARRKNMQTDFSGHLLNSDYFAVQPASRTGRQSTGSVATSRGRSRSSMTRSCVKTAEGQEEEEANWEIEDIETLLSVLRAARIDREKREAVDNYLEHAIDLSALQDEMHEIMSIFVFQASRRQLLAHLMRQYDQVVRRLEENDPRNDEELVQRREALEGAVKHANEEVSRLAYWSDIKKMAESGDLRLSLNEDQNWLDTRPGLDGSGPDAPDRGKLPGPE